VIALVLTAAIASASPVTILVLEPDSDDASFSSTFASAVAKQFAADERAKVYASDDVRKLASLASSQQQLGCDSSTCLAEIADALGAQYVVFGSVVKLGDERQIDLRLFDVRGTSIIAREQDAAHDRATTLALAPIVAKRLVKGILPPPALWSRPLFVDGLAVGAGGAVVGASSGVLLALANSVAGDARSAGSDKALARGSAVFLVAGAVLGAAAVASGASALVAGVIVE
jgi:hypothetical protein